MKRLLVLAAILAALIVPSVAGAQGGTIINELRVRLWPEYDRSDLLVIYTFSLAPGTLTPTQLQFRVPAEAQVTAVAQDTPNGLFSVDFTSGSDGDWQTVTFEAADQTNYQLEYYVPIQLQGDSRQFKFTWPGDYPVNTFVVEVQEPSQTTGFTSSPTLPNESLSPDNLPIHSGTFGSIDESEQWALDVNYSRSTDELTVSGQPVQPSGGAIDSEIILQRCRNGFLLTEFVLYPWVCGDPADRGRSGMVLAIGQQRCVGLFPQTPWLSRSER